MAVGYVIRTVKEYVGRRAIGIECNGCGGEEDRRGGDCTMYINPTFKSEEYEGKEGESK